MARESVLALCRRPSICYGEMVTDVEVIAWAAGVFEGEGSAILQRVRAGWRRRLQIANTEPDVVERAREILRVGSIRVGSAPGRPARHKPELFWQAHRWTDIEFVAGLFYPFLGERRRNAIAAIFDHPAKRALIAGRFERVLVTKDPRVRQRTPSVAEWWAWAAGLFEGEGSAICRPVSRRRPKDVQRRLQIPLCDRDVLDRFALVVGAGKVRPVKDRGPTRTGKRHRPMFIWTCSRWSDIERICDRFLRYMGSRRTTQIKFLLAHPAGQVGGRPSTHCKRGHPLEGPAADVYVYGRERQCRRCKALAYVAFKNAQLPAVRRPKTHCVRGHPLVGPGSDVYVWRGMRQCRPCANAARRTRRVQGRVRPRRPRSAS